MVIVVSRIVHAFAFYWCNLFSADFRHCGRFCTTLYTAERPTATTEFARSCRFPYHAACDVYRGVCMVLRGLLLLEAVGRSTPSTDENLQSTSHVGATHVDVIATMRCGRVLHWIAHATSFTQRQNS